MTIDEARRHLDTWSTTHGSGITTDEQHEQAKKKLALDQRQWNEELTTKNYLAVDKERLKTMIRGLTKWYVKRDNTEVGEPNTAVGLLYDDVMFGIDRLPSATPQEPRKGHWISHKEHCEMNNLRPSGLGSYFWCSECDCGIDSKNFSRVNYNYCPNCGAKMESEDQDD